MKSANVALLAGAALCVAGAAVAQQKITLTVAAGQPPAALPSLRLISTMFIPGVNKRLADEKVGLTIEWKESYAGSLLKPLQVMDGTRDGIAEIGYLPNIFHPDRLPLDLITYVVPFTETDPVKVGKAMNKLHASLPEMGAQYTKFGLQRLAGSGVDSFQMVSTFPVKKFEDLKGRKIASAGGALLWLRGTGAVPVQSNMMEYYNSMKTGVYEASLVFASAFPAMKYPEVAPHIVKADFGAMYAVTLIMNKGAFDKLPAAAKKIFLEEGEKWGTESDRVYQTAGEAGYKALPGFKATLTELPREEIVKWAKSMPNIAKEWAERMDKAGLPGTKALTMYMDELRAQGSNPARHWDKE
jgi:TRAP-type C4-dicarboxylate transport system substrate-binding protein